MTTGKSDLIEITAEFRMTKGGGTAIFQGELDENDKEVWVWLPTSQIENNNDGTFTLPEWLAKDKGLI
ncbi:MAG: hypothetical protein E6Q97_34270 [Desulfurellales bacterium]|nr:MAG: hypothetical protein E6Q97_34270 [Desulfurellales bacterium]